MSTSTVASLFSAAPADACTSYINLRNATSGFAREAREHCEGLWRDYAPLADRHFLSEFPRRFHERWFEMYLTVALIRAGLDVDCPKPGPDVLLTIDGRRIWIEATCANPGDAGKPDSVSQPRYPKAGEPPVATRQPVDEMTLRISNSLRKKEQAFACYIKKGIVKPGDVTAIAVNVHAVGHAWADMTDLMRRALYGLGHLTLTIDLDTHAVVGSGYQERPTIDKKSTGEPVAVAPFVDGSLPHVSAVVGSREDAANRPARLGDWFELFPNLSADAPWPKAAIRLGREWTMAQSTDDESTLERVSYLADSADA